MNLNLKVPSLSDRPLIIAETRPKKIQDFLDKLPKDNEIEATTLLVEEIEIINRQKVSATNRFKAMEVYREKVIELFKSFPDEFTQAHLPLNEASKNKALLAQAMWVELSYGYKLALIDYKQGIFNRSPDKTLAQIIHRAIESLKGLATVYHLTYITLPNSLWSDIYQLYQVACLENITDIEVSINEIQQESINTVFKKFILLAIANPKHLPPKAILYALDHINKNVGLSKIYSSHIPEKRVGHYLIKLNSTSMPIVCSEQTDDVDLKNHRILSVVDLVLASHQYTKSPYPQDTHILHTSNNFSEPYYIEVVKNLVRQWGSPKKRKFNRSSKVGGVEIGVGLEAAHYFIGSKKYTPHVEDNSSLAQRVGQHPTSRWQFNNISAGGMGLRKFPNVDAKVMVGDLVSIKNAQDHDWSLGVLRWANNSDKNLDIGTELIAPQATPAEARSTAAADFQAVLILPELPALHQPSSIVSQLGLFNASATLELKSSGNIVNIMMTKLIERSANFERFEFSYLSS